MKVYLIELQPTPNQQFSTNINNIDLDVTLKYAGGGETETEENQTGVMLFSLQINGEYVCPFVPCFAQQGLLPYRYMIEEAGGNFIFETDEAEYPNWENFGTTCNLYFVTTDEL